MRADLLKDLFRNLHGHVLSCGIHIRDEHTRKVPKDDELENSVTVFRCATGFEHNRPCDMCLQNSDEKHAKLRDVLWCSLYVAVVNN